MRWLQYASGCTIPTLGDLGSASASAREIAAPSSPTCAVVPTSTECIIFCERERERERGSEIAKSVYAGARERTNSARLSDAACTSACASPLRGEKLAQRPTHGTACAVHATVQRLPLPRASLLFPLPWPSRAESRFLLFHCSSSRGLLERNALARTALSARIVRQNAVALCALALIWVAHECRCRRIYLARLMALTSWRVPARSPGGSVIYGLLRDAKVAAERSISAVTSDKPNTFGSKFQRCQIFLTGTMAFSLSNHRGA